MRVAALIFSTFLLFIFAYNAVATEATTSITTDNPNAFIIMSDVTHCRIGMFGLVSFNVTVQTSLSAYDVYVENTQPYQYLISADTAYSVSVVNSTSLKVSLSDIATSATVHFRYIFHDESNFVFTVVGDSRTNNYGSDEVNSIYLSLLEQQKEFTKHFTINVGDIVQGSGALSSTPTVTESMFINQWNAWAQYMPVVPVVGNHDMARGSNTGMAENYWCEHFGPLNESFTIGNYAFVIYDTYRDDGTAQDESSSGGYLYGSNLNWLESTLQEYHSEGYKIITAAHHPCFAVNSKLSYQDTSNADQVKSILEQYTMLNLYGHKHLHYELTENNVVHLVEGRGGASLEGTDTYGFTIILLENNTLHTYKVDKDAGHIAISADNDIYNFTAKYANITIDSTYDTSLPVEIEIHLQHGNYTVNGADWYYSADDNFGTVIIAKTTVSGSHQLQVVPVSDDNNSNDGGDSGGGGGDIDELHYEDLSGVGLIVVILLAVAAIRRWV